MAENWREGSMAEQQKHMLETGFKSDCKFLVGQEPDTKEFRAHKLIMSRSSEVFEVMFYGPLREKGVVRVRDVTPAIFQALLNHVYCDTLEISDVEMSLSVCSAAHKYNLQPLINKCTEYIKEHLTIDNVWRILDFSDLTANTKLKNHCIDNMLQLRTEEVLSADSWCDVQLSSIVTLLQQDTLNVDSELSLLSACQRWAQHQLDLNNPPEESEARASKRAKRESGVKNRESQAKLREIIAPLLPHIRILSLTPQQFLQFTEGNPVFSEQEQFQILKCLTEPQKYKMPEGMCEMNTERGIINIKIKSEKIDDKLKIHLEAKQMLVSIFNPVQEGFAPSTTVPITMNYHILVYGFSYKTLKLLQQNFSIQACLSTNKIYNENFTVQFINDADKSVVFEFKYTGILKYDTNMKVEFPCPFLAQKCIPHSLKIEFHHQRSDRKYPFFHKNNNAAHVKYDGNFAIANDSPDFNTTFPYINKLFYKVL